MIMKRIATVLSSAALAASLSCSPSPKGPGERTFKTPEEAVRALTAAAKAGSVGDLRPIFGPEVQQLIDSSDPDTARRNREVFRVAVGEAWRLEDHGTNTKVLVIGHEEWPFPVPLVSDGGSWRFDTTAGIEEVIDRRIGRNELAAIRVCRTFVAAQRVYAERGHDGNPAGLFARTFRSDADRQNGLYWPAVRGQKRSPLGDLLAEASEEGRATVDRSGPSPFHGYYFKILTAQGSDAPGGAKDYVVNGGLSGGFALVAWPAQYDATGVMTFVVNHDGSVRQKDLGSGTDAAARAMALYNPNGSWETVQ